MQKLIFFGSDQYSAIVLSVLITASNFKILSVITDRPKPVGKAQTLTLSHVEKLAIMYNLKVSYYPDFNHSLITKNTLGLCASFDHLLPPDIINLFGDNLYNLHPSLLPQYRNVSPVQYALALGDAQTGMTLFRISTGIDNGEIIAQTSEVILPTDTTPTLTSRLFEKGAQLFLGFIADSQTNQHTDQPIRRPAENLVFTRRLTRDSGFIEWPILQKLISNRAVSPSDSVNELLRLRLTHNPKGYILADLLRALTPWPGVWSKVPTKKGELRITLLPEKQVLISGKPKPITYSEFEKYYL